MKNRVFALIASFCVPLAAAEATHSATLTRADSDTWYLDITVTTTAGDDWNASELSYATQFPWQGTAALHSPLDNAFGAWSPPFPYGTGAVDSYVLSPSNAPTQFPSLATSSFDGNNASVAWFDPPQTVAPISFLAARIAFDWPSFLEPLALLPANFPAVVKFEIDSATQIGEGTLFHSEFVVGLIPEPASGLLALLALGALSRVRR